MIPAGEWRHDDQRNARADASGGKSFRGAGSRLGGFFFSASHWGIRMERTQQSARSGFDFVNGGKERGFIVFGRFGETADLAHKLQGRSANFLVGHGRFEVEQGLDVSAHVISREVQGDSGVL
ncbi:MAG TPA: hypothetical protein VNZ53_12205 [Steroidobacteraceae bacterium]|nr:hypothetical protein [Steroidobacteraceae bacterium]